MSPTILETPDKQEPIAVIGAACRFSGEVSSLGDLWDMISKEKSGNCKVPSDRWDADVWYHPDADRKGGLSLKNGYFLQQDVGHFDAPFFSTTAKEAAAMDPMKRLLLEVSYESIENAGIPLQKLMNSQTGCYVGCMTNDYEVLSLHDIYDIGHAAASATSEAMTANRVSWFFGLQGPSLTLDTACSSSLYALHLACQSLRLGETSMSLVAGVNLMLNPNTMHQLSAMHMLSPEGVSHTFDDRANGYGRGEGIGCMVVKRLSDALRDGDSIRAVIRATGANADGKTPSITQPSSLAQADLIRRTYEAAGLPMTSTQYFESHGTGTPVGDPIELTAIASTLGASRKAEGLGPLYVGSVKPNVGHTEGCSGLAGVFKAITCLEKGMLVPTYDVQNINPKLTLDEWNLALPSQVMQWPSKGQRRVSVNSFGFGGANAHVILDDAYHYLKDRRLTGNHSTSIIGEEYDEHSDSGISSGMSTPSLKQMDAVKRLIVFSSKDQSGLKRISDAFADSIKANTEHIDSMRYLSDLEYTLAAKRTHHDFRSYIVSSSVDELSTQLAKGLPKIKRSAKQDNNLICVFTGQGAQWPAMGLQLLSNRIFRQSVQHSQEVLKQLGCAWNALDELAKEQDSNIALPEYSQTLCTVLQVALVDLLRHWQVSPRAVVGHSSGEIAAAYAASYITHEDAVKIAYVRGLSSASVTRPGAMMAAGLSRDQAQEYIRSVPENSVVIACINSPQSVTLSGDVDSIDILEKSISADGKFARKLKVKVAYHSPHMRGVADSYLERMGKITPSVVENADDATKTVMYSSLTGKQVSPAELTAEYWVANMCAPVEFCNALTALVGHSTTQLIGTRSKKIPVKWGGVIEIGPHAALQGPVQQTITASGNKLAKEAPYMSMLMRGKDANDTSLSVCGQLWAFGYDVELPGSMQEWSEVSPKTLTDLPAYPWNHSKRFWHEAFVTRGNRFPVAPRKDLVGVPEDLYNPFEPRWRNHLRLTENPWIEDHQITGTILYPGAGMLVMALEGAMQTKDPSQTLRGFRYRDVRFMRGLVVPSGDEPSVETRLSLQPHKSFPGHFNFSVYSTTTGTSWTRHCTGSIVLEYENSSNAQIEADVNDVDWQQKVKTLNQLKAEQGTEDLDVENFYDHLDTIGMQYGPLFRNVISLTAVPSQHAAHAVITIPDTKSVMPEEFEYDHVMHPATMDSIFHLLLAAFNDGKPIEESAVPYSIDEMFVAADQPHGPGTNFEGYGKQTRKSEDGREVVGDLIVADTTWTSPKLVVKNFALRQVTAAEDETAELSNAASGTQKCARVVWKEDIDFFTKDLPSQDTASTQHDELRQWILRRAHKSLIRNALVLSSETSQDHAPAIFDLSSLAKNVSFSSPEDVSPTSTIPSLKDVPLEVLPWKSWVAEDTKDVRQYDLIVVLGRKDLEDGSSILDPVSDSLAPNGQIVLSNCSTSIDNLTLGSTKLTLLSKPNQISTSPLQIFAPELQPEQDDVKDVYLLTLDDDASVGLTQPLAEEFSAHGIKAHVVTFSPESVQTLEGKYVLSLLETQSPLIYSWSDVQFATFKQLIATVKHLFWLTRGGVVESWNGGVEFAVAQGLLRVLRNEYPLVTLPLMDVSPKADLASADNVKLVCNIWGKTLAEGAEMEYAELNGMVYIPRAVEDSGFDGELDLAYGTARPVLRPIADKKLVTKAQSKGSKAERVWIPLDDELPLQPNEVEIKVQSVGLTNSASEVSADSGLIYEVAGTISAVGEQVKSFELGQTVMTIATGSVRTHVRQDSTWVARLPAGLPANVASNLTYSLVSARYALMEVAHLNADSSVLIHSAASAIGQAAIQTAQSVGARLFALVHSTEEKQLVCGTYGVSEVDVFDSALRNYTIAVLDATQGQGADVIFSPFSNEVTALSLSCLSDFGHLLDLSNTDSEGFKLALPDEKVNASLTRIAMDRLMTARPAVIKRLLCQVCDEHLQPEKVKVLSPHVSFPIGEVQQAIEALTSQQYVKVSLQVDADSLVFVEPAPAPSLQLDQDSTYVLAGGLGALGLQIAHMMVASGAKNLVFLSRSGGAKNEADLQRFRKLGVDALALKCDVNDKESVADVFARLRSEGKTIRGVIQCAMVLEDTIFDNMTYEKWCRAINPKTHGSRNLLSGLSADDKPFFILLSSITGIIGNTAQANYASGNTFEDGLAHYAQTHLNIAATSIDVGLVSDSSHFTSAGEFGDLEGYLHRYQHGWVGLQTTVDELKIVIQAIMRGSTADGSAIPAQFVLGLGDELVREPGATGFQQDQKFNLRVTEHSEGGSSGEGGNKKTVNTAEELKKASTLAEATEAVEEMMKVQVAIAIGVEPEEIDVQKPLFDFGVDSLKAVEFRNRALKELQSDISVFELLSAAPLAEIATKIASRSALVKQEAKAE